MHQTLQDGADVLQDNSAFFFVGDREGLEVVPVSTVEKCFSKCTVLTRAKSLTTSERLPTSCRDTL
jgi:hypothetical protein